MMNSGATFDKKTATVATSYYAGAIDFARQLCQQKKLSEQWLSKLTSNLEQSRINASDYEWLLDEAASRLDEPLFGLKYGQQIDISSFNLLGYLAMSSATLAAASKVVNQYGVLVSGIGQLTIDTPNDFNADKPLVKILWLPRNKTHHCSTQMIDGVLAGWIQFGKKFLGEHAEIDSVHLTARSQAAENYASILNCSVNLNANQNFILFDKRLFTLPLKQAEPTVHAAIQLKAEQAVKAIQDSTPSLAQRISAQLPALIFNGRPTLENLADNLHMTTRSLQRKLKQENLSYRLLLDTARRQMTLQLLEENEQPLVHISGIVGFNDQSSFNRAFKRWTGQSPRQFLAAKERVE